MTNFVSDNGTHTATSDQTGYVNGRTLERHGKMDKIDDGNSKSGLVLRKSAGQEQIEVEKFHLFVTTSPSHDMKQHSPL